MNRTPRANKMFRVIIRIGNEYLWAIGANIAVDITLGIVRVGGMRNSMSSRPVAFWRYSGHD